MKARVELLAITVGAALAAPAASAAPTAPSSAPAAADATVAAEQPGTRYELLVVGVYRPLDLEGRTVVEPREVYLQSVDVPQGPLTALIGRDLEVIRQAPVPAAVPLAAEAPDAGPSPTPTPAESPEVVQPTVEPLPTTTVPTPVARLQVTAVRGDVVVARVMYDGVDSTLHPEAEKPDETRVDLPAVLAGDLARYVEPPPPIPAPPPLTDAERARLEAEQRALEKDDARRKVRPKPYQRPVMRWKL